MTRRFAISFFFGLLAFLLINLLAAHLSSDCGLLAVFGRDFCADDIARFGWPLQFYEEGGFAYHREFSTLFLLINITVGILISLVLGWIYARRKQTLSK